MTKIWEQESEAQTLGHLCRCTALSFRVNSLNNHGSGLICGTQPTLLPHFRRYHKFTSPMVINHRLGCHCPLGFSVSIGQPVWPYWAGKILAKSKETGILGHPICLLAGKDLLPTVFFFFLNQPTKNVGGALFLPSRGTGVQTPTLWTSGLSNLVSSPTRQIYMKGAAQNGAAQNGSRPSVWTPARHSLSLPSEAYFSFLLFPSLLPEACKLPSSFPDLELSSHGWKGWWALKWIHLSGITEAWACIQHTD